MNTREYMQALKARYGISSDYALAKQLGVAQQTTSRWAQGKGTVGDELAPTIAEALNLSTEQVLADLHAERERDPALQVYWRSISEHFARAACVLCMLSAFYITLAPRTSEAATFTSDNFLSISQANINSRTVGLLQRFRRWLSRLLAPLALAY